MNTLYITPYVPSQIRTRPYNLIRALVRMGHQITLLTAASTSAQDLEQADELRTWGMRVEVFPVPLTRSLGNCLRALPTRQPLQAAFSYHPEMEQRLNELIRKDHFDVVHVEHLRAARLLQALSGVPTVYDSVDCISLLFEQAVKRGAQLRSRLMAALDLARTRRYEAQLLMRCRHVVVTSQRDKDALEKLAHRYLSPQAQPAPITVITNGVDLQYFRPQEDSGPRDDQTIVFTGKMSYHANIAAVLYFAQEVLPHIWNRNPQVRFQIVGKDPPEAVQQLAADGRIEVTGTVEDLRPYLAQATVAVCPALYAVGIQNKVLEAMAMGTPVVSTSAGCAALAAEEGQAILTADGAEPLAAAVMRVLSDPTLAERLSIAGQQYVEAHHSWEAGARRLVSIYGQSRLEPDAGSRRPHRSHGSTPVARSAEHNQAAGVKIPPMRTLIVATSAKYQNMVEEIALARRPRLDYLELRDRLGAAYMDYDAPWMHNHELMRRLEKRLRLDIYWAKQIAQQVKEQPYDTVLSMSERTAIPLSHMMSRQVKHVVILHHPLSPRKMRLMKTLGTPYRWNTIVALSQAEAKAFREAFHLGPDRVRVLHEAIDTDFYTPRAESGSGIEPEYVFSLGVSSRDYPTLIRAMRKLPHVSCQISATSAWAKPGTTYGNEIIPENVHLKSYDHPETIRDAYARSRFIVISLKQHLSQWSAGSASVLQPQAMGKPVIATRTPGMPSCSLKFVT